MKTRHTTPKRRKEIITAICNDLEAWYRQAAASYITFSDLGKRVLTIYNRPEYEYLNREDRAKIEGCIDTLVKIYTK